MKPIETWPFLSVTPAKPRRLTFHNQAHTPITSQLVCK